MPSMDTSSTNPTPSPMLEITQLAIITQVVKFFKNKKIPLEYYIFRPLSQFMAVE